MDEELKITNKKWFWINYKIEVKVQNVVLLTPK